MRLVIDIGNTNTKIGLFQGATLSSILNIKECNLKKVQQFVGKLKINSCIVSSVQKNNAEILSIVDYYKAIILTENTKLPIKNLYKTPDTLGSDRLALVVGAYVLYPNKDIIVFDAGTCLTLDIINRNGEYLGGRISPGISMRYTSLNTFTDNLPLLSQEEEFFFVGDNTCSSIKAGVQHGILAEVRLAISDYKSQNPNAIFLITGGDASFFEKELKNSIFAAPNLILIGLNKILHFNE